MAASDFTPPPTYADPVVVDEVTGKSRFNPIWLKWFIDMAAVISAAGGGGGAIQHNLLGGIQGGTSSEYYHLRQSQHALFATSWILQKFSVGSGETLTIPSGYEGIFAVKLTNSGTISNSGILMVI